MLLSRFHTRLIALCVIPLLLLAIVLAAFYVDHIQDENQIEAEGISKSLMTVIDNNLNARIGGLRMLANSPLAHDATRWNSLYQEAQGYRESFGSHIVFADANLRMQFNTRLPFGSPMPALPQPKGRSAVEIAKQTLKPAVGDPFIGPVAQEPLVAVAAPGVRDNAATHFLITTIEVRELQYALEQVVLPRGWRVALLDGAGAMIARHNSTSSHAEPSDGNTKRFAAKSSVSPWSVVVEIPRNIYVAPMVNAVSALVAGILLATVLAILGGKLAARRLGKSVTSLTDSSTTPVPHDDIAEVSAVRRMLVEAADKRNQAEAARRGAEERERATIEVAARKVALSEARLRGVFDSASEAIITVDESQSIVMANAAAADMFRCRLDEMMGAPLDRFIPARHREHHRRHVQTFGSSAVNARRMGGDRQVMGLRADGEEFPIDAAISHFRHENERLYTVILRDITERVHNRKELQRYADIVESSGDAILSRLNDGTIVTWNNAAEQIFGYTREEMIGKPVGILYSPQAPADGKDLYERAARGERIVNFETVRRRKDGTDVDVAVTMSVVHDRAGQAVASSAILRDITERKRMEAELKHMLQEQRQAEAAIRESRDQLRDLNTRLMTAREQEQTRIARELHDDLGQSLTALKMDTAAIDSELDSAPSPLKQRTANMKQMIDATVASLRRIITDLRPAILDSLGLVMTLEWLANEFAKRHGIAVELGVEDENLEIGGDAATAIFRIVQESLTNIAKHAQADKVRITINGEGGNHVVRIADNGKGMDEAARRKARSYGLLGMRERVMALGGMLEITSTPGAGTVIEATIPRFGMTG